MNSVIKKFDCLPLVYSIGSLYWFNHFDTFWIYRRFTSLSYHVNCFYDFVSCIKLFFNLIFLMLWVWFFILFKKLYFLYFYNVEIVKDKFLDGFPNWRVHFFKVCIFGLVWNITVGAKSVFLQLNCCKNLYHQSHHLASRHGLI